MKPGSDGHMFFSTFQLVSCYNLLVNEVEEMDVRSTSGPVSKRTSRDKNEAVCDVESIPLPYTQAFGTYIQHARARKADHTNELGSAIHVRRTSTDWEDDLAPLKYNGHEDIQTTNPWWTNVMSQIPHVPLEERIVALEIGGPCRNRAMRAEQKPVAWISEIMKKFSNPEHVVVDLCARTFAPAKACMMLPRRRQFTECQIDTDCHKQ